MLTPLQRELRFIPAGAGNTSAPTIHSSPPSGSSPLARGTPGMRIPWHHHRRFIPAGAGNTPVRAARTSALNGSSPLVRGTPSTEYPTCCTPTVHPRWRGEHESGVTGGDAGDGSSPLARGTHRPHLADCQRCRFIPAGAGNTSRRHAGTRGFSVHPRWRGEHSNVAMPPSRTAGSSPLARGTLVPGGLGGGAARFIPAGAGNTGGEKSK